MSQRPQNEAIWLFIPGIPLQLLINLPQQAKGQALCLGDDREPKIQIGMRNAACSMGKRKGELPWTLGSKANSRL